MKTLNNLYSVIFDAHALMSSLKQAIMITVFVLIMMLVVEYLTIKTKGKFSYNLQNKSWLQIIFAGLMGLTPGCLGTFAIVSMYIHRTIALPALVTALIATSGDEAFIMFSLMPQKAFLLMAIIFAVAIISGFVLNLILKDKSLLKEKEIHGKYHKHTPECKTFEWKPLRYRLKNIIWQRVVLIIAGTAFITLLFVSNSVHEHLHIIKEESGHHATWGWQQVVFLIVTIIGLFINLTVPNHFLKEHLWNHVIKKHFLKLFLWTFGAFFMLHILNEVADIEQWIKANMYIIMILAIVIGMIPESGPHMIFITMFVSGMIPFSVLVANSIVQDGHGSIPLIAESGRSFIVAKLINVAVGFIVGYSMFFFGM